MTAVEAATAKAPHTRIYNVKGYFLHVANTLQLELRIGFFQAPKKFVVETPTRDG